MRRISLTASVGRLQQRWTRKDDNNRWDEGEGEIAFVIVFQSLLKQRFYVQQAFVFLAFELKDVPGVHLIHFLAHQNHLECFGFTHTLCQTPARKYSGIMKGTQTVQHNLAVQ